MTAVVAREATAEEFSVTASNTRRAVGAIVGLGVLLVVCALSVAIGAKTIPLETVWHALFAYDHSADQIIIRELRLPRTVLGLVVGVALGVGGALIQGMTRNPLADPGLLGVNAGSAFFVAIAVGLLGLTGIWSYMWFAFAGAALIAVMVYLLGSMGRGAPSPIRLTLAGVAVSALLTGITLGLTLLDPEAFDEMRYWRAGSIAGRDLSITGAVLPFIAVGLILAVLVARSLNALALGDDAARSLGADVGRTRVLGTVAVTLLCGAATAAAGPISFVGLMIPHIARWIVGPDQRWIVAYSVLGGATLVLLADVVGRVVIRPGEMQVGVVTAFIGAPVLIVLVRRANASGL
ncbi:FecCD family ABC transporter permease [Gordonia insulae]|uniref:Ferric enterobactin transport system permease protein FepD n=1 Tax=Gordonia insulae TaxID=2420509 RepID=A0A3G8JIX8_9ACTN|nr:iron chelate uptake ABC transporter family permease subunit [Gordonia insulae]AZG45037.1 Ferric enterobactin transport system permease protein FepD [Gordonia insulae]